MIRLNGVYVLVDGQFGSTGKGVLAAHYAAEYAKKVELVVSNAGPNSGHTFYHGTEKHVLKQLPTFAVAARLRGHDIPVFLSPGAVINRELLNREVEKYNVKVLLHKNAAIITQADVDAENSGTIAAVAGTRQGVGSAIARKVLRDPTAVVGAFRDEEWHPNIRMTDAFPNYVGKRVFVEVSQGFSLGLNSHFYPKVTSRECTVAQALADARIAPQLFAGCAMSLRTFPIRVGNFEGHSSGDCYNDQEETTWEKLGVPEEMTTVTQRVRRVFTFSQTQFVESLLANRPNELFLNFMNYLPTKQGQMEFVEKIKTTAHKTLGRTPKILLGYGPSHMDIRLMVPTPLS